MFKYKMVNNSICKGRGEVESYKHLLWECREARHIFRAHNQYITSPIKLRDRVICEDDVFGIRNKRL
jgi:hypothetical protein